MRPSFLELPNVLEEQLENITAIVITRRANTASL